MGCSIILKFHLMSDLNLDSVRYKSSHVFYWITTCSDFLHCFLFGSVVSSLGWLVSNWPWLQWVPQPHASFMALFKLSSCTSGQSSGSSSQFFFFFFLLSVWSSSSCARLEVMTGLGDCNTRRKLQCGHKLSCVWHVAGKWRKVFASSTICPEYRLSGRADVIFFSNCPSGMFNLCLIIYIRVLYITKLVTCLIYLHIN